MITSNEYAKRLCDLVESYFRAGDECVPTKLRRTTESDIADAMYELRYSIGCDECIGPKVLADMSNAIDGE